jgi:hypothetical protein
MAAATALHPSRETPATIVEAEVRLVTAHALFTVSYLLVLLGLPGLYGPESLRMGRLGLVGFLLAYLGTMLIAVSGNFGFLAPVLATESPQTIDAINRYPPEVALNAVAFVGFVVGFLALGVAMAKTGGPSLASPAFSSPWVPPAKWLDSLWASSSHRRCGYLPSLEAWPSAPALPGPATECGSIRRLDPRPPAPAEPIAIPHLSRSDEQRRRGVFVHIKPTVRCYTKSALGHRPAHPRPRPVRLRLCRRRVKTDPSASTSSRITDGSRRTAMRSIRNCRGAVLHT